MLEKIKNSREWMWYTKPRPKAISILLVVIAMFILIIHVPYISLLKDLLALIIGAMGVFNLIRQGDKQ